MVGLNLWKQVQSLQCRIPYEGTCFAGYKRISLARERESGVDLYLRKSPTFPPHLTSITCVCVCVAASWASGKSFSIGLRRVRCS